MIIYIFILFFSSTHYFFFHSNFFSKKKPQSQSEREKCECINEMKGTREDNTHSHTRSLSHIQRERDNNKTCNKNQ